MTKKRNLNAACKRIASGLLAAGMLLPSVTQLVVSAEEPEKFPYALFGRNGIAASASSNLCINCNVHTNTEAEISAANRNQNGAVTTGADIEKRIQHVYADQAIMDTYFTKNCTVYEDTYINSEMNIHVNQPIFANHSIALNGNVSLNSYLGTYMSIDITGEVENANNSVLYSK